MHLALYHFITFGLEFEREINCFGAKDVGPRLFHKIRQRGMGIWEYGGLHWHGIPEALVADCGLLSQALLLWRSHSNKDQFAFSFSFLLYGK
jgi:hypothetical protein